MSMRINRIAMVLLFLMGIYILAASGTVLCANLVEMAPDQVLETMKDCLVKEAAANIYPGMFIPEEKEQELGIQFRELDDLVKEADAVVMGGLPLNDKTRGMIGKGARLPEVVDAMKKYSGVYFGAIGGAGALLAKCIKKCELIAYEDLGAEALRKLYVEDMP